MEASALQSGSARPPRSPAARPLLRLQGDERLIAMIRRGHHGAFETLVSRYESRLLAFCRHMLELDRGRRGRAAGGLRLRVQRDLRRRAADQRSPVALPDRAQPLPEPPAPPGADRSGLDGRLRARRRSVHGRHRAPARGVPQHRRRRAGAARDPAHGPAAAGDRRALLRPDRRGDGHHGAEHQVAPRARARVPGRGCGSPDAHLRGGAARARRGGRGPDQEHGAGAPPPARRATAAASSRASCARARWRWPRSSRSGRC